MSNKLPRPRDSLESRSKHSNKSLSKGFGVVRFLTNASQQAVFDLLDGAEISNSILRRKPPLHLTVVGFINMSRREQVAFHAGMDVKRLEERMEEDVSDAAPRVALAVELGRIGSIGNFIYADTSDNPLLLNEQVQMIGQVSMHGISPRRINRRVMPPHIGLGHTGQYLAVEELREQVEGAVMGQTVALQKWDVYPDRYS